MNDIKNRPNKIPWPPLIYISVFVASSLLNLIVPLDTRAVVAALPFLQSLGAVLMVVGLGLDFSAMYAMYRARTNILPHRAADKLLTSGVFSFTRNPIYVGNTLLLLGTALHWPLPWLVPATFLAALAVDRLAIRREETHLALRFGSEFTAYMRRTPRWIGRVKISP